MGKGGSEGIREREKGNAGLAAQRTTKQGRAQKGLGKAREKGYQGFQTQGKGGWNHQIRVLYYLTIVGPTVDNEGYTVVDPSKTCRPVILKSTRALRTTSDKGPMFKALEVFSDVEDAVTHEATSSDTEKEAPSKRTRKRRRQEPRRKMRCTPTPSPMKDEEEEEEQMQI